MADLNSTGTATAKVQLDAGQSLRVETEGGTTAVTSLYGAPDGTSNVAGSATFGPYGVPAMLRVQCVSGTCNYATVRDEPAANTLTPTEVAALKAGASPDWMVTLATLPAASAANAGRLFLVADENGGTLYRSNGASMVKQSPGRAEYDTISCLWADRGVGAVGQVKRISNAGNNPLLEAIYDGTRWAPRGGRQLIYSSRANIDGSSATTSAATIPSVTIPGGMLGLNFGLDIEIATHIVAGVATTANTVSLTFDGFELLGTDRTTSRRLWLSRRIRNMNSASLQTVMANASATGANEGAANDPKETTKNSANDLVIAGTATAVAASAMVNRIDDYKIWWIGA